jgi:hypothetical protein
MHTYIHTHRVDADRSGVITHTYIHTHTHIQGGLGTIWCHHTYIHIHTHTYRVDADRSGVITLADVVAIFKSMNIHIGAVAIQQEVQKLSKVNMVHICIYMYTCIQKLGKVNMIHIYMYIHV